MRSNVFRVAVMIAIVVVVAFAAFGPSNSSNEYGATIAGEAQVTQWREATDRFEDWLVETGFTRTEDTSVTFRSERGQWEMTRRSGPFASLSGGNADRTLESATLYAGDLDELGPVRFSLVKGSRPLADGAADPAFLWADYGISGSPSNQAAWDDANAMLKTLVQDGAFTPPSK